MNRSQRKSRAKSIVEIDSDSEADGGSQKRKKKGQQFDRSKRKSRTKSRVDSDSENDIFSDGDDDGDGGKKRQKLDEHSTKFRMKDNMEEIFVMKCVQHFDKINCTATLKGPFTQKKQTQLTQIWEKITEECNTDFKVSNFHIVLIALIDVKLK